MPAPILKLLSATVAESDADLLGRFVATRDEPAFTELVRRHGPAVYRVCRRLAGPSADDAFQAAFLVLACRAGSVRRAASVGGWLIGVAGRVSRQMRRRARRAAGVGPPADVPDRGADVPRPPEVSELAAVLDDELSRLPSSLRDPVALCLIGGRTQEQAAAALGGSVRTVRRRLDRAKAVLRARLERRGVAPAVAAGMVSAVGTASAAVPPDLARGTVGEVVRFLAGGAAHTPAAVVAKGVVAGMTALKTASVLALTATAAGLVALGVGLAAGPNSPGTTRHHPEPTETDPMRARVVPAVLALPLLAAPQAGAQTPEMIERVERQLTLKRLEGVWVPDLLVTTQGAEAYPLGGRMLGLLEGNQFVRFEGRRNVAGGTFKVEDGFLRLTVEDRTPWDLEAPDVRPKTQYAFKVEGDVLTLCYSVGDKGKADDLSPGEGRQVVVYKRQRAGGQGTEAPAAAKQ